MNIIMVRPSSPAATKARRGFFGSLNIPVYQSQILDLDFDNDNEKQLTAEQLDWHLAHQRPVLATD